jgi:hypothetical protein
MNERHDALVARARELYREQEARPWWRRTLDRISAEAGYAWHRITH